jgi:hypothetical protein
VLALEGLLILLMIGDKPRKRKKAGQAITLQDTEVLQHTITDARIRPPITTHGGAAPKGGVVHLTDEHDVQVIRGQSQW